MDLEKILQMVFSVLVIIYGIVIRVKPQVFYKLYCKIFPPHARTQTKMEVIDNLRRVSIFGIMLGILFLFMAIFT